MNIRAADEIICNEMKNRSRSFRSALALHLLHRGAPTCSVYEQSWDYFVLHAQIKGECVCWMHFPIWMRHPYISLSCVIPLVMNKALRRLYQTLRSNMTWCWQVPLHILFGRHRYHFYLLLLPFSSFPFWLCHLVSVFTSLFLSAFISWSSLSLEGEVLA